MQWKRSYGSNNYYATIIDNSNTIVDIHILKKNQGYTATFYVTSEGGEAVLAEKTMARFWTVKKVQEMVESWAARLLRDLVQKVERRVYEEY
jgi:hypothetical protein